MADSDDKTQEGAHKKTLTLKGSPAVGARPGMSRGPRTVEVETRTRVVPHGNTGAPARPARAAPAPSAPPSRPAPGARARRRPMSVRRRAPTTMAAPRLHLVPCAVRRGRALIAVLAPPAPTAVPVVAM